MCDLGQLWPKGSGFVRSLSDQLSAYFGFGFSIHFSLSLNWCAKAVLKLAATMRVQLDRSISRFPSRTFTQSTVMAFNSFTYSTYYTFARCSSGMDVQEKPSRAKNNQTEESLGHTSRTSYKTTRALQSRGIMVSRRPLQTMRILVP